MRFRKGNKVEVFGTKEVPSGSWYSAEIIHGNGHYYTIQYDGKNGNLGAGLFDRVSRKTIRPCPPVMQMVEDWVSGDVVEVFHSFSWKMATVLKALPMDWLLVRLVGSSHELEVLKADIRPRLCWQDDEWKVIGKGLSNGEERQDVPSKLLHNHNSQTMASTCCKNSYHPISNIASQSLKRKLTNCHSPNKAQATPSQKLRATGKDKRPNRFIPLPEKVDYVLPSRAMPVKKCMMPPINNRLTVSNKSALERQKVDDADSFASSKHQPQKSQQQTEMKTLYKKGTVHPSPPPQQPPIFSDPLAFLPAAILTLAVALTVEDREVLAYLLSCSSVSTTTNNQTPSKKNGVKSSVSGADHPPAFNCNCFRCYMSYWVRWDSSPNRQLIHEIIDAFEDWILAKNKKSSGNKGGRRERKRKEINGRVEPELNRVPDMGFSQGELGISEPAELGGDPGGASDGDKGSVRKLVSFIGERIFSVWG